MKPRGTSNEREKKEGQSEGERDRRIERASTGN